MSGYALAATSDGTLYAASIKPSPSATSVSIDTSLNVTGNIGIGITNPTYKLEVTGTSWMNGNAVIGSSSASTNTVNGKVSLTYGGTSAALTVNQTATAGVGLQVKCPTGQTVNTAEFFAAGSATASVVVDASGNVGIGTIPTTLLTLYSVSPVNPEININRSTTKFRLGINSTNNLFVYNSSSVGVYLTNGGTSWTAQTSDERTKENINLIDEALDVLKKLKPIQFTYKHDESYIHYGFTVQDIARVMPSSITENETPERLMQYVNGETKVRSYDPEFLVPYLIKSVQELQVKIEYLYNKLNIV